MMDPTLFTRQEVQSPEKKEPSKKHKSDSWGNTVLAANVIAWYVNPAIYILFSGVYFLGGMTLS